MDDFNANRMHPGTPATKETIFTYLEELRESGVTNMFGAGEYLEREFSLNNKEAKDVLISWMKSK